MQLRKYVDFISRSNRQISSVVHIPLYAVCGSYDRGGNTICIYAHLELS